MKVKLTVIVSTLDNDTPQNVAEFVQELLQKKIDAVVTSCTKIRESEPPKN